MRALVCGLVLMMGLVGGCDRGGAAAARKTLRTKHASEVRGIVAEDIRKHVRGITAAGERIGAGFAVPDPKTRDIQMRTALRWLTKPPRGIPELITSARTFTAAIAPDGVVIATEAKPDVDRMTGVDLGKEFAVVRAALAGQSGYEVAQFPAIEQGAEGSVSLLFAAPAKRSGAVVGAALAGMPLWRLAQRLTKQLQLDHVSEKGAILWVYLFRGDKPYHFGTPPDLDGALPSIADQRKQLAASPGGFTGEFLQFGRWYAFAVVPLRALGDDTHALIVRSDPV
jgi:hypothetical protein